MRRRRTAAVLGFLLITPAAASAEGVRVPATGAPALLADLPPGWSSEWVGPMLRVSSSDRRISVALGLDSSPQALAAPPQLYAVNLVPPDETVRPAGTARVGSIEGAAFALVGRKGRIVLAPVEGRRLAVVMEVGAADASEADRQALRRFQDSLRVQSE